MRKKLFLALEEQLEVEKLQAAEKLSAKDSAYDNLYDKTVENQEEKSKTLGSSGSSMMSNDDTSSSDSSGTDDEFGGDDMSFDESDPGSGDDSNDTTGDAEEEAEPEEDKSANTDSESDKKEKKDDTVDKKDSEEKSKDDKKSDDKKEKTAQEELKELYTFLGTNISYESFGDDDGGSFISNVASKAYAGGKVAGGFLLDKGIDLAKYLGHLGVKYGPVALKHMYKGLIFVLYNIAKGLFASIVSISKFMEKRRNSLMNIDKKLNILNRKISELENSSEIKEIDETIVFANTSVINKIKIGENVDLASNMLTANTFLNKVIKELDTGINNELNMINRLITLYNSGNSALPFNIMNVMALHLPYKQGIISGYEVNDELIESHYYPDVLPGDLVFITNLPKKDINDLDALKASYKLSNMFFGLNSENYVTVEKINYMNVKDLHGLIDNLRTLVNTCMMHEQHFVNIKKNKLKLRYNFKRYYEHLFGSKEKVSLKDSLAEFVQLKSHLIDSVYLTAAMNINDYAVTLINGYIAYIEKNIKEF